MRCFLSFILACSIFSIESYAATFKCDKNQTLCEAQAKRWTVGDKIGVFNEEKQLVALGEVVEIKGNNRIVKITQKWGTLLRNHSMDFVEDNEYRNPLQYFKSYTPLPQWAWGVGLGIVTLGVGDTFTSSFFGGELDYLLTGSLYLTANLHYLSGSGKASDNLGDAGVQSVSVTAYGASIGVAQVVAPLQLFSIKIGADLGISSDTVTLSGDFDEKKVLNNRIVDGSNLYARVLASAVYRRDGIQPELGFTYTHIHQSNSPGLFMGITANVN